MFTLPECLLTSACRERERERERDWTSGVRKKNFFLVGMPGVRSPQSQRCAKQKKISDLFREMSVQSDVSTPRLDREADEKRVVVVDVNSETKSSAAAEVDSSGARLTGGAVCAKKDVADATDSVERSQNIGHSLLSDKAILEHMRRGTVVIRPFVRANLATSSYDVTLGTSYYRETPPESGSSTLYNPFSQAMVERVWGHICTAERADEWTARAAVAPLDNIAVDDRIIVLAPGETILAHTNEFIGGRGSVCQMMKARSSLGRNFIEVCKCAGILLLFPLRFSRRTCERLYAQTYIRRDPFVRACVCVCVSVGWNRVGRYRIRESLDDGDHE
jgi:deoxycytidine triphosphate deaminase